MICSPCQILLGSRNEGEWDGQRLWHAWETNTLRVSVEKPEAACRDIWYDNIKHYLEVIGRKCADVVHRLYI